MKWSGLKWRGEREQEGEGAGGAGMEKVTRVWTLKMQQPASAGVPTSMVTGGRQEASVGEGAARGSSRRRRAVKRRRGEAHLR